MTRITRQSLVPAILILAALSSGCLNVRRVLAPGPSSNATVSGQSDLTQGNSDQGTFPLEVGNQWEWRVNQVLTITQDGEFVSRNEVTWRLTHELFCEHFDGSDHLVNVAETQRTSNGAGFGTWQYRQNRQGLWRSEGSVPPPPGCEPPFSAVDASPLGTTGLRDVDPQQAKIEGFESLLQKQLKPGTDEIRLLAYPLHVGRTWTMAGPGSLRCTVEAYEELSLPIGKVFAWRIRLTWPNQNQTDEMLVWYGESGFVKRFTHVESNSIGAGGVMRRFVTDNTETLQTVHLVDPGSSAAIRVLSDLTH